MIRLGVAGTFGVLGAVSGLLVSSAALAQAVPPPPPPPPPPLPAPAALPPPPAPVAPVAPQACVPGQSFTCACPGGAAGVQICNAAGSGVDPCQCGPATTAVPPPPPPLPSTGSFAPACPSNQVAADGTCLVSPDMPSTPPPPPLPPPAPMAVVVNPAPPPVPAQDAGPPAKGGPNTGLLAGGLALFAVGYGATIGINFGVCGTGATWRGCDSKGLSFVPVVGPFIFAGVENTEASYRVLAVTLGLTQAAGAVLFGLSFAGSGGDNRAKTAYVLPTVSRDGAGATVVGRF